MPLQATAYSQEITRKLELAVTNLIQHKLIPLSSVNTADLHIAMILDVVQLSHYQRSFIKATQQPQGVRVIISGTNSVEAALDFYYDKGDIRFTHCLAGGHLQQFTAALNALEQVYRETKIIYQVACIDFHYATHPYLVARQIKTMHLYNYFNGALLPLHHKDLKNLLKYLGLNRPKKDKKLK